MSLQNMRKERIKSVNRGEEKLININSRLAKHKHEVIEDIALQLKREKDQSSKLERKFLNFEKKVESQIYEISDFEKQVDSKLEDFQLKLETKIAQLDEEKTVQIKELTEKVLSLNSECSKFQKNVMIFQKFGEKKIGKKAAKHRRKR